MHCSLKIVHLLKSHSFLQNHEEPHTIHSKVRFFTLESQATWAIYIKSRKVWEICVWIKILVHPPHEIWNSNSSHTIEVHFFVVLCELQAFWAWCDIFPWIMRVFQRCCNCFNKWLLYRRNVNSPKMIFSEVAFTKSHGSITVKHSVPKSMP